MTIKNVLLTGASSGLGLEVSKKLIENGFCVWGISKTTAHRRKVHAYINSKGKYQFFNKDLSQEKGAKEIFNRIHKLSGGIDLLINCAGYINELARVEKPSTTEIKKNFSFNLLSSFFMCKYSIPVLKKKGAGLIINISSMAGKRAVPGLAAYSISKFGVLALTQCIAKENAGTGLKCITVCPGGMKTRMREKVFGYKDAAKQQSAGFVANVILDIIKGKLQVESGGEVIIRHGKVQINPPPSNN